MSVEWPNFAGKTSSGADITFLTSSKPIRHDEPGDPVVTFQADVRIFEMFDQDFCNLVSNVHRVTPRLMIVCAASSKSEALFFRGSPFIPFCRPIRFFKNALRLDSEANRR